MKRFLFILIALGTVGLPVTGTQTVTSDTIRLTIGSPIVADSVGLEEVVVRSRRTPPANSRWSDLQPVELVTVGGANGDLYRALQTLPGTQVQGETGRLLVRGGDDRETQTYIDGMHVLMPYTSVGIGASARSRYSTFMFSGITLASGGAPLEYGGALSAVLPLETKDCSAVNKLGLNASVMGAGGGGTRTFNKGSVSVDLNYQNMALHNQIYPGRKDFSRPYQLMSGATQLRFSPDAATLFKLYAQYDRTDFATYEGNEHRLFKLGENNAYLNATLRRNMGNGWKWFAGAAWSYNHCSINNVAFAGDVWQEYRRELHLKAKVERRLSAQLCLDAGVEGFIRNYDTRYRLANDEYAGQVAPSSSAAYVMASYYLMEQLKAEASLRTDYFWQSNWTEVSPRLSLSWFQGDAVLSAVAGRYTQLAADSLLVWQKSLRPEVCWQYNLGAQYRRSGRLGKVELYYKRYSSLALWENTEDTPVLISGGYGYSKGFDFFVSDRTSVKNFEYQLSYTYNLSRRKAGRYAELTVPQYATRHNASVVVKWSLPRLRSILSLTDRFSSGRPWHNPERPGLMNDEVKPYNSLDVGVTFLLSKKIIVHASATNVLGRRNEFGRVNGHPVLAATDRIFYVGVYITLGKHVAYDVSNF